MSFRAFINESIEIKQLSGNDVAALYRNDKTLYDRLKYLDPSEVKHETNLTIFHKNKAIAMLGLQQNPYDKNQLWVKHVTVDPDHQRQGHATKLVAHAFEYAHKEGKKLVHSSFTKEGQGLKKLHDKGHAKYPDTNPHIKYRDF